MKDDLISRQAAIDALGEEPLVWCDREDEIAERNQWRYDIDAIKNLPSIQPKTGRWIKENIVLTSYPPQYQWHCNQCGQAIHGFTADVLTDYCSGCGAKMEG